MFGFLRRKTPTAPTSSPVDAPAQDQALTSELARIETASPTPSPPLAIEPAPANPVPQAITPERSSWYARLQKSLSKTSSNISGIFSRVKIDEDLYEALESALLSSDTGVDATSFVLTELRERVRRERLTDANQVKGALRAILLEIVKPLERAMDIDRASPLVIIISGVNGAGKTTSIGKLTKHFQQAGKSVLLAAGDTFRADRKSVV